MGIILEWLKSFFIRKPAPMPPPMPPAPVPEPAPPPPVKPTAQQLMEAHNYRWAAGILSDRRALYVRGREICKEEGLSLSMTADLLATVWGESGWNQWCVNTTTFDYGVAQFSRKYYLVEYKMAPEDALLQPEICLRIMAKNFKAGRQNNWIAYKNGSYKRYINVPV